MSILEKVLTIRSEAGWLDPLKQKHVFGKGIILIRNWDKIMVHFGEDLNILPVELPFGIIEPLGEIYEFEILSDKIHIGGFSSDNSGKWIDYNIINPLEVEADFTECELDDA